MGQDNREGLPIDTLSRHFQAYIAENFTAHSMVVKVLEADEKDNYLSLQANDRGVYLEDVFLEADGSVVAKRTQLLRGEKEGDNIYLYFKQDANAQMNIHRTASSNGERHGVPIYFSGPFGHVSVINGQGNGEWLDIDVVLSGSEHGVLFRRHKDSTWRYSTGSHPWPDIVPGDTIQFDGSDFHLIEEGDSAEVRVEDSVSGREIVVRSKLNSDLNPNELFAKASVKGRDWMLLRNLLPARVSVLEPLPKKEVKPE